MSLPSCIGPAPVISRWEVSGFNCTSESAGTGISVTVYMVSVPACRAPAARSCTVPPTLVCTAIRRSACPLLRMSRYATVVPGVVGCGTYALVTVIDPAALAVPHPLTPSAASSTAPAMPTTAVSLRMPPTLPLPSLHRSAEEAERGRAEIQQCLVETLQREAGAPFLPGPLAQLEDLQLAPGVTAVGRVERGPPGLGQRGQTEQVSVRLEPARGLLDRHVRGVHADGAGQPSHADQRLQPDADHDPGIGGAEAFLHAQFLGVVRPPLDERAGVHGPADLRGHPAQRPAVGEVPGRHLVHGDAGQRRVAEHLQPLLLLTFRPGFLRRRDVVPGRTFWLAGC